MTFKAIAIFDFDCNTHAPKSNPHCSNFSFCFPDAPALFSKHFIYYIGVLPLYNKSLLNLKYQNMESF